jgi:SAM-dependent methyltransferase
METWLHDELAEMGVRHWWYRGRRTVLRAVLDAYLPPLADPSILEVGAGTGSVTMLLTDYGRVTALEPHAGALEACRRVAPEATMIEGGVDDLGSLPGPTPAAFDVVGAFDVIEHLEDDIGALEAMRERVAPEGRLVITVPALDLLWGKHDVVNGHFRRYSRSLLVERLHRSGFIVEYVSYFNSILFPAVAGVRVGRTLLHREEKDDSSDFVLPSRPVNDVLTRLFGLEAGLMRTRALPVGSSLVAVASRAGPGR